MSEQDKYLDEAGRIKLLESSELTLVNKIAELDGTYHTFLKTQNFIKNISITPPFNNHPQKIEKMIRAQKVVEYRLLILIIILDLNAATRAYLKSNIDYEIVFSVRQVAVIIVEGFKNIFHFLAKNNSLSSRNKSFWIKHIKNILIIRLCTCYIRNY